jgi:hypothetical protein
MAEIREIVRTQEDSFLRNIAVKLWQTLLSGDVVQKLAAHIASLSAAEFDDLIYPALKLEQISKESSDSEHKVRAEVLMRVLDLLSTVRDIIGREEGKKSAREKKLSELGNPAKLINMAVWLQKRRRSLEMQRGAEASPRLRSARSA